MPSREGWGKKKKRGARDARADGPVKKKEGETNRPLGKKRKPENEAQSKRSRGKKGGFGPAEQGPGGERKNAKYFKKEGLDGGRVQWKNPRAKQKGGK